MLNMSETRMYGSESATGLPNDFEDDNFSVLFSVFGLFLLILINWIKWINLD